MLIEARINFQRVKASWVACNVLFSLSSGSWWTNTFISCSAPSIENNTIAQSANCNSCGLGVYKIKHLHLLPCPKKFPWKEQLGLCEELRKHPTLTPLPYGTSLSLGCIKGLYRIIKVPCSGSSEAAFQVGAPALPGSACACLLLMPCSEKCHLTLLPRAAGICLQS